MDGTLVGGIGSAVAILASAYAVFINRQKVKVEAESVQVATSDKLVQMVMRQLSYMDEEVAKLQTMIAEYRSQVETLALNELNLTRRIVVLENFIRTHDLNLP